MQRGLLAGIVLVVIIIGGVLVWQSVEENDEGIVAGQQINPDDFILPGVGFRTVGDTYDWVFPDDFGPHPDFQREQWQLSNNGDCPLNINIMLDRVSTVPEFLLPERESEWVAASVFTGDVAIDRGNNTLLEGFAVSRDAIALAGATDERIWIEDWELHLSNQTLYIQVDGVVLQADLVFGDPQNQAQETDWYSYQRPVEMTGQVSDDTTTNFSCDMMLLHRFGSAS